MSVVPDIYTVARDDVAFVALMSDGVGEAWHASGKSTSKDSVEGLASELNRQLAAGSAPQHWPA